MFFYRQFIIAFTRLERFIHRHHIVSCIEKPTGSFCRLYVSIVTLLTATFVVCPLTFTAAEIEICIPTHPRPSYRPSVSHCWREKDLVFSQCTGSQEQYRIIDYSPTKSHQREQISNTYPFEKLRFFIHSGLTLFALTLWESQNIGPLIRTHYPVGVVL